MSREIEASRYRANDGVEYLRVGMAEVEGVVEDMTKAGTRLADLFGSMEDEELVIRLVYGREPEPSYAVVQWPVRGGGYPPLSEVAPAAFVEECEIYEQFGLKCSGAKGLNRLVVPPHAAPDFPRLAHRPGRQAPPPHAPHYVTGEAIEFPVGPVRGVGQESLYMGLVTSGEELIDLYLMVWHKHRGIERRLQQLRPQQALFLVERAEGLSAVGNSWAFCRAVESITDVMVPEAVERTRAVALEFERIYNHAASLAALCQATSLTVGQAQAEVALEELLRLNAAAFGHRYLFGVLAPGGVTRGPDVGVIRERFTMAVDELRRVAAALRSTNSFMDRVEVCGVVSIDDARRLGLVGPVARGSGQDLDTRRDHPYGAYRDCRVEVPVRTAGDCLARMEVILAEVETSAALVTELVQAGLRAGSVDLPPAAGAALGWCESPRGESLVWVSLDREGRIRRARLRPASARNWRAFDDAARSRNVFTDIPIIEASFWLTVAGFAR